MDETYSYLVKYNWNIAKDNLQQLNSGVVKAQEIIQVNGSLYGIDGDETAKLDINSADSIYQQSNICY